MSTSAADPHLIHDHIEPLELRTSDRIPIPYNQQELDTISIEMFYFTVVFDFVSCVGGLVGNLLTILIVTIR